MTDTPSLPASDPAHGVGVSVKGTPPAAGHLGVVTLTLMTTALFLTLRNMPMMAETGLQMVFFNLITVFAFLVPIALVSAELATAWPRNGVFHWVEEAFGTRWGLVAVWLQWVQSLFGITSILSYVAASLAYAFEPRLAGSRDFIVAVILIVYWTAIPQFRLGLTCGRTQRLGAASIRERR